MPLKTALVALVGLALVVLLAVLVGAGMTDAFDQAIIDAVRAPGLRALLSSLGPITDLGGTLAVTVVAALVIAVASGRYGSGGGRTTRDC